MITPICYKCFESGKPNTRITVEVKYSGSLGIIIYECANCGDTETICSKDDPKK